MTKGVRSPDHTKLTKYIFCLKINDDVVLEANSKTPLVIQIKNMKFIINIYVIRICNIRLKLRYIRLNDENESII